MSVKNPETGEVLYLETDGRSGTAYQYLMEKLNASVTKYLTMLKEKKLPVDFTAEDYLSGNYTYLKEAPMPGKKEGESESAERLEHFAGPGAGLPGGMKPDMEPPTLGDLMARPPKGTPSLPPFQPPMQEMQGKSKWEWLAWDGERAEVKDLDSYVLHHRGRMKPCTSFDTFAADSGENRLFGEANEEKHYMHFDPYVAEAMKRLETQFPEEVKSIIRNLPKAATIPGRRRPNCSMIRFTISGRRREAIRQSTIGSVWEPRMRTPHFPYP